MAPRKWVLGEFQDVSQDLATPHCSWESWISFGAEDAGGGLGMDFELAKIKSARFRPPDHRCQ